MGWGAVWGGDGLGARAGDGMGATAGDGLGNRSGDGLWRSAEDGLWHSAGDGLGAGDILGGRRAHGMTAGDELRQKGTREH